MGKMAFSRIWKPAIMAGAALGLSGCMYGPGGGGYYGDGYVNGADYQCDPYAHFDDYYACDDSYGYVNIGFGGGWYDNYYYPGYGRYLFDRGGHRHVMHDHHRRHWARQRADYGSRHGRRGYHRRNWTAEQREEWRNASPDERAAIREERRARGEERRADGAVRGRGSRGSGQGVRSRGVRGETVRGNGGRRGVGNRAVGSRGNQGQVAQGRRQAQSRGAVSRRPAAQARPNRAPAVRAAPRPPRAVRSAPRVSPRAPRVDRSNVNED